MLAAKNQVVKYNADMDAYLGCIKGEYDAKVAAQANATPEQKAEMEKVQDQKHNAAVEEVTDGDRAFQRTAARVEGQERRGEEALLIAALERGVTGSRTMLMLTPAQAETLIEQHLACLPIESLPLTQAAGAVLRENIYAERDHPPFDRVAMDGIALSHRGRREQRRATARRRHAGRGRSAADACRIPTTCIEIMTGAMLPRGCDAVVPVEQVQRNGEFAEIGRKAVQPWQNVHRRGSDCPQGALLLAAGTRLSAPEVAIAAGAGMARLRVSAQPMIVVISTGNELVEPGELIEPHQVRRSNAYGITAALRQHGFARVADDHVRDDEARAHRAARLPPAHPRRADPVRRRVDGQTRPRAEGAREARREPGVPSRRAAARQADVVRRVAGRPRGVRAARQPGVDAGVPVALRAARAARRHGPGARRTRRASPSPRPWRSRRRWRSTCR